MSKVSITRSLLDDLATSISEKSGESVPMTLTEMKDAVDSIQTGGTLQTITKSYTPTESQQTETITAGSGYDGIEEVDVTVGAISSTYVGSGITRRDSTDLTASGATVSVPSGYYASNASKAVSSGAAGTPTATKGTVSNHQVSITPSVTNTSGYISGGTKTGTAVTVSASELVSGTKSITENGTGIDVSTYEYVDVSVSGTVTWQTLYDGNVTVASSNPNYWVVTNYTTPFLVDETYRVMMDSNTYTLQTSYDSSGTSYDGYGIGDSTFTNPSFVIYRDSATRLVGATTLSAGTHYFKLEKQVSGGGGTYETVSKTYRATTSQQTDTITASSGYDAIEEVDITIPAITQTNLSADNIKSGTTITISNGTSNLWSVTGTYSGGSSKNAQVVQSTTRTSASTLTAIGAELTVSKTGTYDIYYSCFRTNTSTSYTWATRLYINGTAYGTAENTTWTNNQQNTHLSNISLTTGDKLRVYGRNTRGTSYYVCAPMLAIVEA